MTGAAGEGRQGKIQLLPKHIECVILRFNHAQLFLRGDVMVSTGAVGAWVASRGVIIPSVR